MSTPGAEHACERGADRLGLLLADALDTCQAPVVRGLLELFERHAPECVVQTMSHLFADSRQASQQMFRLGFAFEAVEQGAMTCVDEFGDRRSETIAHTFDCVQRGRAAGAIAIDGGVLPTAQVVRRAPIARNSKRVRVVRLEQIGDAFELPGDRFVGGIVHVGGIRAVR